MQGLESEKSKIVTFAKCLPCRDICSRTPVKKIGATSDFNTLLCRSRDIIFVRDNDSRHMHGELALLLVLLADESEKKCTRAPITTGRRAFMFTNLKFLAPRAPHGDTPVV